MRGEGMEGRGQKANKESAEPRHLRNKSHFRALARAHRSSGGEGGGDVGEFSFSPLLGLCFFFLALAAFFGTVGWM